MTALKAHPDSETNARKGVREPDLARLGEGAFSLTGWGFETPVRTPGDIAPALQRVQAMYQ